LQFLKRFLCFVFVISSNGAKSGSGSQPLVQWTEVHGHPGLVCALTQTSNTPIVMMVKPDVILLQEIKIQPAKAKVCPAMFAQIYRMKSIVFNLYSLFKLCS
jgi:hypothetical protein